MKIIHILSHTLPFKEDYILNGWASRLAKSIKKYSIDGDYEQECWFAINDIKEAVTWEKNGIKYRMFPAWTLNGLLESFCGVISSKELIRALEIESKKKGVIFHIQGERSGLLWQILKRVRNHPVFLQFHGYCAPRILIPIEKMFFGPIERHYFRFVSYFFVLARSQRQYLIEKCKVHPQIIGDSALGVDYGIFNPVEKNQARKELGLPADKNIILYVGLFNEVKGVKKIIDANKKIRDKYNTFLILIGGSPRDKYYQLCKKNGDLVIGMIPHKTLIKYFNAADVYAVICNNRKAKYGGLGIAPTEALACNTPILNSNLADAPREIKDKIGFVITSPESLIEKATYVFENKDKYSNLHEMTKSYFSWEIIVPRVLKLYDKFQLEKENGR